MTKRHRALPGESESREVLRDRSRAWWLAAVAGQVDQSHPTHGTDLHTRVEGDTLVVTGSVPSASDLREIERETHHLIGHGVAHIRNELAVVPQTTDARDVLTQTLLATYESAEQGGYAAGYLEGHPAFAPLLIRLLTPDERDAAGAVLRALLPSDYWEDARGALDGERALLVVVVDELDAFKARELLEEETQSRSVVVLPPEPPRALETAKARLEAAEAATGRRHSPRQQRGDTRRRRTRAAEIALHEH